MSSFADSFWSEDFWSGINTLYGKLQQGLIENREVGNLIKSRVDCERSYGAALEKIFLRSYEADGFAKDDGASLKKAIDVVKSEFGTEGKAHLQIARSIEEKVLYPFSKFSSDHSEKVNNSLQTISTRLKNFDKLHQEAQKQQIKYFAKCRANDELTENSHITDAEAFESDELSFSDETDQVFDISGTTYTRPQLKVLLAHMLQEIPLKEEKIRLIGIFRNVVAGSEIVDWILNNFSNATIIFAESFGQGLVDYNFLRHLGVGKTFANSSVLKYQWRDKSFEIAEMEDALEKSITVTSVGNWIANSFSKSDETNSQKIKREAYEATNAYKAAIDLLDKHRCELIVHIHQQIHFMETCERERLEMIKQVLYDISITILEPTKKLKSSYDATLFCQELVNTDRDLRYILENYRTGIYPPKVVLFESYRGSLPLQNFGIDLALRAGLDKNVVPNVYYQIIKELEKREDLAELWKDSQQHFEGAHKLRTILNDAQEDKYQYLKEFSTGEIVQCIKIYLMELPDSIFPSDYYVVIKIIYNKHGSDKDLEDRLKVIGVYLQQLPTPNTVALKMFLGLFATKLKQITSNFSEFASEFGFFILRSKQNSSMMFSDRHPCRLTIDLLQNYNVFFESKLEKKEENLVRKVK